MITLLAIIACAVAVPLHADSPTYGIPSIYAPWREAYHTAFVLNKQEQKGCPFCVQINAGKDTDYFILKRAQHHVVILNAFPYAEGHLLIVPYDHVDSLEKLTPEARAELMELIVESTAKLKGFLKCDGFNIGWNIGPNSGASVVDHVHLHIIPRNAVGCSFMQTIGKTAVICFNMARLYRQLLPLFPEKDN